MEAVQNALNFNLSENVLITSIAYDCRQCFVILNIARNKPRNCCTLTFGIFCSYGKYLIVVNTYILSNVEASSFILLFCYPFKPHRLTNQLHPTTLVILTISGCPSIYTRTQTRCYKSIKISKNTIPVYFLRPTQSHKHQHGQSLADTGYSKKVPQ